MIIDGYFTEVVNMFKALNIGLRLVSPSWEPCEEAIQHHVNRGCC